MRICIYGAGAVGGYVGAKLALAGNDVVLIARGAHLQAMQRHGLTLVVAGEAEVVSLPCTDDPAQVGPQDYVIVALKAHSVNSVVDQMAPLLGPETAIVTAQNGIPWWYFYEHGGPLQNHRLESVDPGGRIWDVLGPQRAIGCVVYPSCEIVEPGVIRHIDGKRFMVGEPDGSRSERVVALSQLLTACGFKAPVRAKIRDDIWLKLWGNVSFNPVSVLTLASLGEMCVAAGTREVIRRIMLEAEAVTSALGVKLPVDVDTRIQWAADVGAHKTSMLQDLELGRPMEIDALVAAVAEIAGLLAISTPTLDTVLELVRLRAQHG